METLGYNTYGYLKTISAGGAVRYTITGRNAREQLTAATYGSSLAATFGYDAYGYPSSTKTGTVQHYSYVFNPLTGNLTSRKNELRGLSESFAYDEDGKDLERLTSVTGPQNLTMTYADNGNINTKSDIDATNAFSYGANAGPYALTGVTTYSNIIPAVPQTITYNSFEKVTSISEANGSQTIYTSFTYNSDLQRAKMTVGIYYGSEILTRYYVGGSYMKEVQPNTTNEYTYLGGDAYTAPVVVHNARGVVSYYYLLRDHLGNITHQVNTSNAVVAEFSFDAWGRRRNATNWTYTLDANDKALFADRGFTGHEYLSWYKLYNMNGRLYDPAVGRFLSADPVVQDAGNSQNYNRYSYCLNNPLKYTDPSGYTQADMWTNEMTESMRAALGAWATALGYTVSNGIGSSSGDGFVGSSSSTPRLDKAVPESDRQYEARVNTEKRLKSEKYVFIGFWFRDENGNITTDEDGISATNIGFLISDYENNSSKGGIHDVSQAGLNFIAGFEGFSAVTYNDVAGLPTIGYGHLIKSGESFGSLSRDAAIQLLRKDASFAVNAVNKYVKVSLNQNQFDALTSFTFNIGVGGFSKSSVLRNVNSGNTLSIDKSFMMWNKATINGVLTPVQGLSNRRQAEANLFQYGDY